jgi:hypothetical protein
MPQEFPSPPAPLSFQAAFQRLLARAPGPVFPRARRLYFDKYCLEGAETSGPFRTFLLEEEIQEAAGGAVRIRALAFAVVHWQAGPPPSHAYAEYLRQRWQLDPDDLVPVPDREWFRRDGAYARFSTAAVYERAAPTTLVSPPPGPATPADDPGSSR